MDPAGEKRQTGPPSRLTYTREGQTEVRESKGLADGHQKSAPPPTSAAKPEGNMYISKTPEEIKMLIEESYTIIKAAQDTLARTDDIYKQYSDKQEDEVDKEAWAKWIAILKERQSCQHIIRCNYTDINAYQQALTYAERQMHKPSTSGMVPSKPTKAKSTSSSHSSSAVKIKQIELDEKRKTRILRAKYEDDVNAIKDQIEAIQRNIDRAVNEEDKKPLQNQKVDLEVELAKKTRDYEKEKGQIKDLAELDKEEIQLEIEDDQSFGTAPPPEVYGPDNEYTSPDDLGYSPPIQQSSTHPQQLDYHPQNVFSSSAPIFHPRTNYIGQQTQQQSSVQQQLHSIGPTQVIRHSQHARHYQQPYHYQQPRDQDPQTAAINNLADAMKGAFRELKIEKEWEPRDLPTFSGKAEDWPIFFNEFMRTTPEGKVNSSQNAIRLRKALKGSAKDAVVGLLNDPSNVSIILEDLERRFGRNELVIQALIDKVEQAKSPDLAKPETIIPFGTTVRHLVESVRSLKEDGFLYDRSLLQKLVNKLPGLYRMEWLSWVKSQDGRSQTLSEFGDWIVTKLNIAIECSVPVINLVQLIKDDDKFNAKGRGLRGSASVNVATTDTTSPPSKKIEERCQCCEKGNHLLKNCYIFKKMPVRERSELVKKAGCCFRCLGTGHLKKDCSSDKLCGRDECIATHHPLLHFTPKAWKNKDCNVQEDSYDVRTPNDVEWNGSRRTQNQDVGHEKGALNIGAAQSHTSKPLSIVRVRVTGSKGTRKIYAMLDSGADTTVIQASLAKDLGITGHKIRKECRGIGGNKVAIHGELVTFGVSGAFKKAKQYQLSEAVTMTDLGLSPYTQSVKMVKENWPYLRKAKLESYEKVIPQLIIGEDHPYVTAHREILQRSEHEPMAKRTLLGWVIAGKGLGDGDMQVNTLTFDDKTELDQLLRAGFSLDSFGTYPKTTVGSVEDRRALEILQDTVKKNGEIWECGLLWRDPDVKLPDSRPEAVSRLISNERRMKRDEIFADMYHAKIEEYLKKGYIHELSADDEKVVTKRTMYIPHFGVFNVNKPGKLRLVFDAACKNKGVSLNEHLLTGPDLIRPLPSVLMNFRRHNIAINGDIEDMFHRVSMKLEDRDSQRFLWRKTIDDPIKTYTMDVLIFGACSSPSSAIFVKNRNAEDFRVKYPEAVKAITDDFYCDDCLTGAPTVEEAVQLREQITEINAAGNFNVKKWLSNSKEVMGSIPEQDRAIGLKGFGEKTEIPTERVLGLWYRPEEDVFTFSANYKKIDPVLLEGRRPTKREMCGLVMSVFDPLGFIANYKIKGLILLQHTWITEVDWDDDITDDVYKEWLVWVNNLKETEMVTIPRCYCYDLHLSENIQLHTLVDASAEACCTICYLRVKIGACVQVTFVCAKTKVAPTKKLTTPRLELTAAVMGACLSDKIMEELDVKIRERFFWSDSRTVLMWIRSQTLRYKEFVANRVNKIHLLSNVSQWRWIPTALNTADGGTRLNSKIEFCSDSLWLTGPIFLQKECDTWPTEKKDLEMDEDALMEERKITVCVSSSTPATQTDFSAVVICERFSSYSRLCRAQAAVIKVARYWIARVRKTNCWEAPFKLVNDVKLPGMQKEESGPDYMARIGPFLRKQVQSIVSPPLLEKAELMILRKVQWDNFQDDVVSVKLGKLRSNSKLQGLSPFLQHELLKVRGRIQNANIPDESKFPIILPSRHWVTELLILKEHERNGHQGQATVLSVLRQKYWIVEGRSAIRRAVERCQLCKLSSAKPVFPKMGDLPYYRLSVGQPPFTYTGVDLFGPLEVVVGRHHEKRWVSVFTCMVTRAIHLEVVYGLSTDEIMMAISRFVDQRGRPRHFYSDNGTNFVGANKELKKNWEEFDWNRIVNLDKFREITWHFNPPCSPHFGGAWERMVQSVKRVLKKTLNETFPKDQTLLTMIKGAENIINSRPITYVSSDPTDPEALTPNHFLRGFSDIGPSLPGQYEPADEVLRSQWRRAQIFLEKLWERWTKEVLPELSRRDKWHVDVEPIGAGDIVLMVDDQCPRNMWKRAVVTAAFPGKDGQVRVVDVETSDFSSCKKSSYRRGVDKIVPLGLKMGKSGQLP